MAAACRSILRPSDLAQLARCAWLRQQMAAADLDRANREFATLAMWTRMGQVSPPRS
jgi:hypothetical protein